MKKILLLIVLGICTALSGWANPVELVLHKSAGHKVVVTLAEGMSISLSQYNGMEIKDATDAVLYSFELQQVASLTYQGDIPVSVDDVLADSDVRYILTHEGIRLQGLSGNARVLVYAPNGQLLHRMSVEGGGCTIQRAGLPKGVVIVKINDDVLKIMNQ